jgi:polyhydroxybutyrate depolymerase
MQMKIHEQRKSGTMHIVLMSGLAALTAMLAPLSATAAERGCTLAGSGQTESRTLGSRSYLLHVPNNLSGEEVPLLLALHGFGSNGAQMETYSGWSGFADQNNFIVAYPQGTGSTYSGYWDPYTPFGPDVDFVRDVVADIWAEFCIDLDRVHVDGWSNGAVMSQRVACDAADLVASANSYAGGTPTLGGFATACAPSRPIPVSLIAGQFDFTYAGLAPNTTEWRGYNACAAQAVRTTDPHGRTDTYACAAGTEVVSRVVNLTSHEWPSGAKGEDQRQRIWAFFQKHPRP